MKKTLTAAATMRLGKEKLRMAIDQGEIDRFFYAIERRGDDKKSTFFEVNIMGNITIDGKTFYMDATGWLPFTLEERGGDQ